MTEEGIRIAWLHECPGVGPAVLRNLLRHYRGAPPPAFFGRSAPWYRRLPGVSDRLAASLARHLRGIPIPLANAPSWPIQVRVNLEPPALLEDNRVNMGIPIVYCMGGNHIRLPRGNICVVSSGRQEFEHADAVKMALQNALSSGWRVVAGHNRPVYQWAILTAKRMGAPAIMVLDRGLLAAFGEDLRRDPVPAARIWGYDFDAERMCALSPFRLRDPWIGANARLRDAIVVGLSQVVIAIGVREGGTMDRLCREAAERGKVVLAAPDCFPFLGPCGASPWLGQAPPPPSQPRGAEKIG